MQEASFLCCFINQVLIFIFTNNYKISSMLSNMFKPGAANGHRSSLFLENHPIKNHSAGVYSWLHNLKLLNTFIFSL
jgi:hypothetical protein